MKETGTSSESRGIAISQSNVVITHEDIDRAHDRERVSATRALRGLRPHLRLFWLLIGPGILVILAVNVGLSVIGCAHFHSDLCSCVYGDGPPWGRGRRNARILFDLHRPPRPRRGECSAR